MRTLSLIALVTLLVAPIGAGAKPTLPKTGGSVSLDFHDVDIADVVKAISEITGKNFILDDSVRGRVTIISPTPVTVEEAYEAFISALKTKGLTTVEAGKLTKIIKERESASSAVPFESGGAAASYSDQIVTRLIPLKYINVNEIRQALNNLVARQGSIVAYGPTNSLIVTDSASNIARLMKIIQKLDKQGFQSSVEVIPIRFAQAEEIAEKLVTLFESEKKGSARRRRSDDVEGGEMVSKIIPDTRTNAIIVTATREGLGRILDIVSELDRKVEQAIDRGRIHVKYLKHANAEELADLLTSLLSGVTTKKKEKGSGGSKKTAAATSLPWERPADDSGDEGSSRGSLGSGKITTDSGGRMFESEVRVVADPSTNAVVITASPTDYETIAPIIDQLDIRRPQVFVEALIMEVNIKKLVDVGVSAHGGAANGTGALFGQSNLGLSPLAVAGASDAKALGLPGMVLGGLSTKGFTLPGTGFKIPAQGFLFKALQEQGALNVLSAPNILTADNKKAEILVGSEMPVETSQFYDSQNKAVKNYTRQKVGISLAVTPQINEGDEVTLEIEQKIQQPNAAMSAGAGGVVFDERTAKTTVIAQNAQTIVIGGLIKDQDEKKVTKVPLLGDIPLLGYLFRNTSVNKEKINLMIFLTPHVIHEPADMTRVSVRKNMERRKFNKTQGVGENRALYDYDLDSGLNMAPPPDKSSGREEVKPKRRFNFDEMDSGETKPAASEEMVERRPSRRTEPASETAVRDDSFGEDEEESPRPRRPASAGAGKSASAGGNPFADVRPPSSN